MSNTLNNRAISITLRRGLQANLYLAATKVIEGEPVYTTDEKQLYVGDASNNKIAVGAIRRVVTTQFDKTNATLATVTGLTALLQAGHTYEFRACLHVTADATGGYKFAIDTPDTLTATSLIYQVNAINNGSGLFTINSRQTALAGAVGAAVGTTIYIEIIGTIKVNAAGTLAVRFAQNAANGTSSVLVGSTLMLRDIPG